MLELCVSRDVSEVVIEHRNLKQTEHSMSVKEWNPVTLLLVSGEVLAFPVGGWSALLGVVIGLNAASHWLRRLRTRTGSLTQESEKEH